MLLLIADDTPLPTEYQTEQYGVDLRNVFNCTPLMMAARANNIALAQALLERGANAEATDNYGRNAFQLFLDGATRGATPNAERFASMYRLLAPTSVSLRYADRLYKLDQRTIEFVLYNVCAATTKSSIQDERRRNTGLDTTWLLEVLDCWPAAVLSPDRKRRQYLSGVLARNEISRDYAYNRRLFLRTRQGEYVLNPLLEVRAGEDWVSICELLNYSLISDGSDHVGTRFIAHVMGRRDHLAEAATIQDVPPIDFF